MTVLKAKHFTLRPWRTGDEVSLQHNINDRVIYRWTLLIPYPYTLRHAKKWVRRCIANARKRKKTAINFAIDVGGKAVGGIGLKAIEGHKAEIGYWLGKKHRNKGIMTKAVKLVTAHGFRTLKLHRIEAAIFPANKASGRVLEKAGYDVEGILRKRYKKNGRLLDDKMYAKVR